MLKLIWTECQKDERLVGFEYKRKSISEQNIYSIYVLRNISIKENGQRINSGKK